MTMRKVKDICAGGVITGDAFFINAENVVRIDFQQLSDRKIHAVAKEQTTIGPRYYALEVGPYSSIQEAEKNFAADSRF